MTSSTSGCLHRWCKGVWPVVQLPRGGFPVADHFPWGVADCLARGVRRSMVRTRQWPAAEAGKDATIDGGVCGCRIPHWRRWWGRLSLHCFQGETSDLETTIDSGVCGRRIPRWRRYGGLLDRMIAMSMSTRGGWMDVWTSWWLGIGFRVFLTWRPRWSGMSSTISNHVDTKMEWHVIYYLQRQVSMAWCSKISMASV
jgi:hypothetical protein